MFSERLESAVKTITSLSSQLAVIEQIADLLIECLSRGGVVWTAGNGGSAAQALHFSEELVGRYRSNRRALASAMLGSDPTVLTCIANDYGFDQIFARPLQAMARPEDALLVLSTSGNSPNILAALDAARSMGCTSIGLLGGSGGNCLEKCDATLVVPSEDSAFVQDAHQVVIHLLCEAIETWTAGDEA